MTAIDRELLEELIASPLYGPVIADLVAQQVKGKDKYNTLLTADKWDAIEFITHLQQELTDGNVYLEGVKQNLLKERSESALLQEMADLREKARNLEAQVRILTAQLDRANKERK